MKRILIALLVALALPYSVKAQDQGIPVAWEGRLTLGKDAGSQAIAWRPTGAMILDLGKLSLGLSFTPKTSTDSTQQLEFFVPLELYSFLWKNGERKLTLETYIGTDLTQGTALESRTLTLGAIYSSPTFKGLMPLIRAQARNYDWIALDGSKTSLTDWAVQVGVRKNL